MAYFSDLTNFFANSYPTEGFDFDPFMNMPQIPQHADSQTPETLPDPWGLERPEFVVGSSTTPHVPDNHGSVASVTPYITQDSNHIQLSHGGQYLPVPQDHLQPTGFPSWDNSLANAGAPEPSTVMPTLIGYPLGDWEDNQSGRSTTAAFYPGGFQDLLPSYDPGNLSQRQNAHTPYQLNPGPTRTELSSARWHQPYETRRVPTTERENAAVGTSTPAYPPMTYIGPQPHKPSGGLLSETSADAEQTFSITEQDEVPRREPRKPRLPNGQGKYRKYRVQTNDVAPKLLEWAQKRRKNPSFNEALAEALEAISAIRPIATEGPYLRKPATKEIAAPSKNARKERKRRAEERRLYEGLSMRYPPGKKPWERSTLLAHVVQDLETHPALQNAPEDSTPQTPPTTTEDSTPEHS